jgi:HK97 family phage prohead protease
MPSDDAELTRPAELVYREDTPGDGRTILIRMARWDTPAMTPEGYREQFARGAFAGVDASRVTIEAQRHGGSLVGRGQAITEGDDGAILEGRIAPTPAGDELLALIRDGVLREASVVYRPTRSARKGDVYERQAVDLWRVAVVERGVHPGAGIMALRAVTGGHDVDTIETIAPSQAEADGAIAQALAPVLERMERLDGSLARMATLGAIPAPQLLEGGEHATLGDWLVRARESGDGAGLLSRALADQVTTDNAVLVRPAYVADAVGIVNNGRPTIEAFGGAKSLPDSGMDLQWPELVPLAGRAIAVQAAQKTEVVSRIIKFTQKSSALATYAGASDISIQLLKRSSPAYRDLYSRVMLAEYARVTDDAFCDAVIAGATGAVDYVIGGDTDGTKLSGAIFAASVKVKRATGAPASVAIVAEDVFVKLGGWLKPVSPTNAVGTATAAGLNVSLSGIDIVLGNEDMAAGGIVVSNRQAASWYEDGPNPIEAVDVARLGLNYGFYGIAGTAITIPAGIVRLYDVP